MSAIIIVVISWVYLTPIWYESKNAINESIGSDLEGEAKITRDAINSGTENALKISVGAFILCFIYWAYSSMQEKEYYSGAYK